MEAGGCPEDRRGKGRQKREGKREEGREERRGKGRQKREDKTEERGEDRREKGRQKREGRQTSYILYRNPKNSQKS